VHVHRRKVAGLTDERVRIMDEILSGIRVIKMYCWEHMFGDLVKNVRRYTSKITELIVMKV
jgi:ATP-binding cassette subfamily C (CFTR/MRP) protein 4